LQGEFGGLRVLAACQHVVCKGEFAFLKTLDPFFNCISANKPRRKREKGKVNKKKNNCSGSGDQSAHSRGVSQTRNIRSIGRLTLFLEEKN